MRIDLIPVGKSPPDDINVVIEVPTDLSSRERELLEQLREASSGHEGPLLTKFLERMKRLFRG